MFRKRTVTFFFFASCLLLLGMTTSCSRSSKTNVQVISSETGSLVVDSLKFDSTVTIGKNKITCKIDVDYPIQGNPTLLNSIREWINENMYDEYTGNLSDGKKLVHACAKNYLDSLAQDAKMIDGTSYSLELMSDVSMKKMIETSKYVTYAFDYYIYSGGAHGMQVLSGATFRKSDGRKLGWDMFSQYHISDLQEYIKEGLKQYFKVKTEEELKDNLMDPDQIYNIPLPQMPPYFTKDGVCFVYQPYEIACYAAGMPTFTIPYNKLRGKLTLAASDMLK